MKLIKIGIKFGNYAVRDLKGIPNVLGLRELATRSAKDTATYNEILFAIDFRFNDSQTEMKFNELLLESYREEILTELVKN